MPTFSSYPALEARAPDIAGTYRKARQQAQENTQMNALRQAQLKEVQGAQGRRDEKTAQAKATKHLEMISNMLQLVESAPEAERPELYQMALQHARSNGIAVDKAPQQYDSNWNRMTIARAGDTLAKLGKLPTGYQRAEGGGMELAPGYAEGQATLAAAKPSSGMENIGTGGTFMIDTPAGQTQVQGYFNKRAGQHFYRDAQGNEKPLPSGARKITPSSETFQQMRPGEALKLNAEMNSLERGTRQIYRYLDSIGKGAQGLELLADRWVAKFKTIFGPFIKDGRLDQAQLATLIQNGQIQGLLGAFRKEVVGGGVMTEQDALRVLAALGGDLSATRNKQVAVKLLRDILTERLATYNDVYLPTYNRQGKLRSKTFKPKPRLKLEEKYFSTGPSFGPPTDEPGAELQGYLNGRPVYKRPDGTYFSRGE